MNIYITSKYGCTNRYNRKMHTQPVCVVAVYCRSLANTQFPSSPLLASSSQHIIHVCDLCPYCEALLFLGLHLDLGAHLV